MSMQVPKLIWLLMLLSNVIYLFLVFVINKKGVIAEPDAGFISLEKFFPIVAVFFAGTSFIIKKIIFSILSDYSQRPAGVKPQVLPAYLVAWALCEGIAVLGFVSAILLHEAERFIPYGASAFLLIALHFPRADHFSLK